MSANNYILVGKNRKGYRVSEQDIESQSGMRKDRYFKTLREAVKYAASIQDTAEYGVYFSKI